MRRMNRICRVGLGVVGLGMLFCVCGSSFSSQWQTLGDDSWGDTANSGFGLSLRTMGNVTLLVGFTILAGAAWIWLNAKEREAVNLRAP